MYWLFVLCADKGDGNAMINGKRLRMLRENAGLTQKDLADRLKLTPKAISFYERSEREPSGDILISLANLFNTTTDYLLGKDRKISGPANVDLKDIMQNAKILFYGHDYNLSDSERQKITTIIKTILDIKEDP